MIISPEILSLANSFFSNTVENNEVMVVKWTFEEARFPDLSLDRAERDRSRAAATRAQALQLLEGAQSHEDRMVLEVLLRYCDYIEKNFLNYWQRFDLNATYRTVPTLLEKALSLPSLTPAELSLKHEVLAGFVPFVRGMREKLEAQAARGIRLPRRACKLVSGQLESCAHKLETTPLPETFQPEAKALARELLDLAESVGGTYLSHAPEDLGLCHVPGGLERYAREMQTYLSCDATPEQVIQRGYEELARTEEEMLGIARSLGYHGTLREAMDQIAANPRYRFSSPNEMQEALTGYLDRIRPLMPHFFSRMPKADCGVARTSPADEESSSWGYYSVPVPGESDRGIYYYSAAELDKRCQIRCAAVVYHELLPGHHYQMNLVLEDPTLPDIIHHHYDTAFADGWAEYASALCRELGLYTPIQDFGRLSWDAFLCCRLIVDTGINAFGWTYNQAIELLREHTMFTELEMRTELVRYATAMPAQALAYKWGSRHFQNLRARAERELGPAFNLKRFHDDILAFGAIPLDVLDQHMCFCLGREAASAEEGSTWQSR